MNSEKFLPNDMRLEMYFKECLEEISLEVEDIREKTPTNDILDPDVEFDSFQGLSRLGAVAYTLNNQIVKQKDPRAYEAMYRGVVFSHQLAQMVYGDGANFDAGRYINHLIRRSEEGFDELIRDTHLYLSDNENVSTFIECYIDELDGKRGYPHLVEIAAAMICMLTERSLADRFMAEESANCSIDRFET